jgi:hypothetical protein
MAPSLGGRPRGGATCPPPRLYKGPQDSLAQYPISFPLLFLAWLPCLELCQRVDGNSTCRTPSHCQNSSPNPSPSAALLDRSPDDVYTPYVCNPSEALLVRRWSSSTGTTTRPWGWLWLSFSTTFMQEHSRALGLQGYEYYRCSVTLQLRRIDHGLWV